MWIIIIIIIIINLNISFDFSFIYGTFGNKRKASRTVSSKENECVTVILFQTWQTCQNNEGLLVVYWYRIFLLLLSRALCSKCRVSLAWLINKAPVIQAKEWSKITAKHKEVNYVSSWSTRVWDDWLKNGTPYHESGTFVCLLFRTVVFKTTARLWKSMNHQLRKTVNVAQKISTSV